MNVLIIGANGLLGRTIAAQCIVRGWRTDAAYHINTDHIPEQCARIPIPRLGRNTGNYDIVFLAAAHIPYGNFNTPGRELSTANVRLVLDTAENFPDAKIVFASSVAVYGTAGTDSITENHPFDNPTLYGLSKIAGECVIRQQSRYAIIRFSSLYGNGMTTHTFLPNIIRQARQHGTITLYGNGERYQDYLHIDDAATLALAAAEYDKNGIFLGVQGTSISNLEAARIVQSCYPATDISFIGTDSAPSCRYDNRITQEQLMFSPHYSTESGIRELCSHEL